MVTVAVCVLALLFAAGSVTPLLLSDDLDTVVELHAPQEQEPQCSCCASTRGNALAARPA
jgi:hypothetical protein